MSENKQRSSIDGIIIPISSNNVFDIWLGNVSVDKTGAYKMTGTPIQLTDAGGHLDGDSRPAWTA